MACLKVLVTRQLKIGDLDGSSAHQWPQHDEDHGEDEGFEKRVSYLQVSLLWGSLALELRQLSDCYREADLALSPGFTAHNLVTLEKWLDIYKP